jgi:hypothetical protein
MMIFFASMTILPDRLPAPTACLFSQVNVWMGGTKSITAKLDVGAVVIHRRIIVRWGVSHGKTHQVAHGAESCSAL